MARFNLLNYADENGEARPGLGIGDEVIDLGEAVAAHERATGTEAGFSAATTLAVLDRWDAALPILEAVADGSGGVETRPMSGVDRPRGIFLKPGDTVTIEFGGIGTLRNPVVQGE